MDLSDIDRQHCVDVLPALVEATRKHFQNSDNSLPSRTSCAMRVPATGFGTLASNRGPGGWKSGWERQIR